MITQGFRTHAEHQQHIKFPLATIHPITAEKAQRNTKHFCIYCGSAIYKKVSPNGISFFALYDGQRHTSPICQQLSRIPDGKKAIIRTTDIPEFDPDAFLRNLMLPNPEDENGDHNDDDNDGDDGDDDNTPINSNDEGDGDENVNGIDDINNIDSFNPSATPENDIPEIEMKPVRNIKPLIDNNYHRLDPETIINKSKKTKIKDILLSACSFNQVFSNKMMLNGVTKIIEMQPQRSNLDFISCRAYNKIEEKKYDYIYFNLIFGDGISHKKYYESLKESFERRFFEKKFDRSEGRYNYLKKYSSIFVAGKFVFKGNYQDNPIFEVRIQNKEQICALSQFRIKDKKK